MSITDELRSVAAKTECANGRCEKLYRGDLERIADRIDAEHERQLEVLYRDMSDAEYVKLPKDADGEYVQPSDIPHLTKVNDGKRITFYPSLELRQDGTWRLAGWTLDRYRISKPTVEDVLREMMREASCQFHDDGSCEMGLTDEQFDKYAQRLQLKEDA